MSTLDERRPSKSTSGRKYRVFFNAFLGRGRILEDLDERSGRNRQSGRKPERSVQRKRGRIRGGTWNIPPLRLRMAQEDHRPDALVCAWTAALHLPTAKLGYTQVSWPGVNVQRVYTIAACFHCESSGTLDIRSRLDRVRRKKHRIFFGWDGEKNMEIRMAIWGKTVCCIIYIICRKKTLKKSEKSC